MEPNIGAEGKNYLNRTYSSINGTSGNGSGKSKKSRLYLDILLREWRWFLAVLLAGGFIVLPASKNDINEVKAAVASTKETVTKLDGVVQSLPKTIGILEESRVELINRMDKLETKLDSDRQILFHIEEKIAMLAPFYPYVVQSPPSRIPPAVPASKSKNKK